MQTNEINPIVSDSDGVQVLVKEPVFCVTDNKARDIIVPLILAFFIPILIMGYISVSSVKSYTYKHDAKVNYTSVSEVIEADKEEDSELARESRLKEERKFRNVLKKTLYENKEFNRGILSGVLQDVEDAVRTSKGALDIKYNLAQHFDAFYPFLVMSSSHENLHTELDSESVNVITGRMQSDTFKLALVFYILRFGIASVCMCGLALCGFKLSKSQAVLLSLVYSLSSLVVLYAQASEVMNLVILLPLVLWEIMKIQQRRDLVSLLRLGIVFSLLFASGMFGVIYGLPFIIPVTILLGFCSKKKFKDNFISICMEIPSAILGLCLSCPVWLSWFQDCHITHSVAEAFKNNSVKYTFVDFLYRFFAFSQLAPTYAAGETGIPTSEMSITDVIAAGSLGKNAFDVNRFWAPSMYCSIAAILLLCFFVISKRIPVKARITALVLVFIYHLSYAFTPFDVIFNIFDIGVVAGTIRFVFVNAVLAVMMAMALREIEFDLNSLKYALAVVLGFIILAAAIFDGDEASSIKLIFNAVAPLIYFNLLINTPSKRIYYPIIIFLVSCELLFVTDINYKTNTVSAHYIDNPIAEITDESTMESEGVEDIYLLGNNSVSFVTADYTKSIPDNIFKLMNGIYEDYYDEMLFVPVNQANRYTECLDYENSEYSTLEADYGKIIISYDEASFTPNSRFILYSGYREKTHLHLNDLSGLGLVEKSGTQSGEFIKDITDDINSFINNGIGGGIQIELDALNVSGKQHFVFELYAVDEQNLSKFNALFTNEGKETDGSQIRRVVTNRNYSDNLKVAIDLKRFDTYNCCGKLAFDVDSDELVDQTIRIVKVNGYLIPSMTVMIVALFIIGAILIRKKFASHSLTGSEVKGNKNA